MDREIEFRGKLLYDDDWAYGYYLKIQNAPIIKDYNKEGYDTYNLVEPNTIGQYTGLTDKNGTKIFEGDIVKYGRNKAVVEFSSKHNLGANGFEYDYNICGFFAGNELITDAMIEGNVEVIGNVFDNGDLTIIQHEDKGE